MSEANELCAAFNREPANEKLRTALFERYLPLVRYNAERVWSRLPSGVDLNSLLAVGVFNLFDAIDTINGRSDGLNFESYCTPRLRHAMLESWERELSDHQIAAQKGTIAWERFTRLRRLYH